MRKKGFTLIELLAVIIILAVIALITTPIVLRLIEDAKIQAFKDTGYGLIESAKYYYMENTFDDTLAEETTFTFPESGLSFKGENPKGGTLVLKKDGRTKLDVYNDTYCATKGFDEAEVTVVKVEKDENGNYLSCQIILTDEMSSIEEIAKEIINKITTNEDKTYTFPNSGIEGITEPEGGTATTTSEGKIEVDIYTGEYCAYKVSVGVVTKDSNGNVTGCSVKIDESVACSSEAWNGSVDTSWYNTTSSEFTITTSSQLAGVAKLVNEGTDSFTGKTITLGCNINLNDTSNYESWATTSPSNTWTPIGNKTAMFEGDFDGGNYEISGMYINNTNDYQGLIGYAKNSNVSNVTINNSYVSGSDDIALLIGYLEINEENVNVENINIKNSEVIGEASVSSVLGTIHTNTTNTVDLNITNIKNYAKVSSTGVGEYLGSLVGFFEKDTNSTGSINATIDEVYNYGAISGKQQVGGLIGYLLTNFNNLTIKNSTNSGNVSSGINAAGIVANIDATITNFTLSDLTNEGTIKSTDTDSATGGIIGADDGTRTNSTVATNLVNSGTINGASNVAGLIGNSSSDLGTGTISLTNSKNTGSIVATGDYIGGLIGNTNRNIIINKCFNSGNINNSNSQTGGLIGYINNNLEINNSYNIGDITTGSFNSHFGGLVGVSSSSYKFDIENCYNAGNISASGTNISGVVGEGKGSLINVYNAGNVTISNTYYTMYNGGIIGFGNSITMLNNYNSGKIVNSVSNSWTGALAGDINTDNSSLALNYYLKDSYTGAIGGSAGPLSDSSSDYEVSESMPTVLSVVNGDNAFMEDTNNTNKGYPVINYESTGGSSESGYTDESCFTVENGVITAYSSTCSTEVNIPMLVNGQIVKQIGDSAFVDSNIEKVIFPNTLKVIGQSAFNNVSTLTGTIVIPSSVTTIGSNAFEFTSIVGLDLSNATNLTSINSRAFAGTKIENLDLSDAVNLTTIGSGAFNGVSTLTGTIVIPSSVTTIGSSAFIGTKITGLDLTQATSLTTIGSGAFNNVSTLTGTIVIPSSVTTIESSAFQSSSITGLDLSNADSLTTIGSGTFNVSTLTGTIVFPSSITTIDGGAFAGTGISEYDFTNVTSDLNFVMGTFAGNLSLTTIKVNSNHSFSTGSLGSSTVSKIIVNAPHTSPITLAQGHGANSTITIEYNDGKCSADYNSTFTDC